MREKTVYSLGPILIDSWNIPITEDIAAASRSISGPKTDSGKPRVRRASLRFASSYSACVGIVDRKALKRVSVQVW
jgi:hypothetical protein